MDMQNIISAVVVLFVMGVVFAILLGVAAKVFAVEVDERIPLVRECLPGANCGGCGFPGCDGLAAAIVEGTAPVNGCPVGGAACAAKIAEVLGVEADAGDRKIAHVYCNGGCAAADKANYEGLQDCTAAMRVAGGPKACAFGCMGLGSCVKACAFNAIHIVDGVAKVDSEKCVACGKCVAACPKKLIDLVSETSKVHVNCKNTDKGPEAMKVCENACIGCKMCEKTCKFDAIHVENGVAKIDYAKCKNCKMCAKACPKNCIEPIPTAEEKAKFKEMQAKQAAAAKEAAAKTAEAPAVAKTAEGVSKLADAAAQAIGKVADAVADAKEKTAPIKEAVAAAKEKIADAVADAAEKLSDDK